MNEKQQELYEKLLKKVNKFCLGQAAEDVIEAIDDLVENYERYLQPNKKHLSIVKLLGKPTLKDALTTIYTSQDIMGGYDDFWEAYRMIETAIKALEIIKNTGVLKNTIIELAETHPNLSLKDYELLKEILK